VPNQWRNCVPATREKSRRMCIYADRLKDHTVRLELTNTRNLTSLIFHIRTYLGRKGSKR
jgi:hypothetical protein